ncbi:MAG TPA: TPM domain-containing protein [Bacteroidia bacterium]|nr:TPM domain-containing protein [Bacteroidia bacterium]
MKKHIHLFILLFLLGFPAFTQEFPSPPNPPLLVNDFTGTLSINEISFLESKLIAFNDTTSTQIAIIIIHSVGGYEIADYAYQLGRKWGIGQKEKNNGALILVALDDHKVYIATGYGLEGAIPDALAKRIVEQDITPQFKQGNYYAGLDRATDTMIKLATGEYTADNVKSNKPAAQLAPIFIIILIVFIIFFSKIRSARSYASMNGMSFWAAWALLNAARGASRGRWGGFTSGNGFGGGGGGFGGFGGGSFGGGGAGGSW